MNATVTITIASAFGGQRSETYPRWEALAAHGITGAVTCSCAPFQVQGSIEGAHFYFRARHDAWSLGLAPESADAAVEASIDGSWQAYGDDTLDLGYKYGYSVSDEDAATFVAGAIKGLARRGPVR